MTYNIDRALKIRGWMQPRELIWLAEHARDCERIIEVGVYRGRTTRCLLDNSEAHIWCIDHWLYHPDDWPALKENIKGDWQRITIMRHNSAAAAEILFENHGQGYFDMIFIDAGHDYESVWADIKGYWPLLKPGGLLCGHDYSRKRWPGVVRAVDELIEDLHVDNVIWWTRK